MEKRIKKLWIEALRSGKYQKGKGFLRKNDCFCAYGVLCDLYAKEKNIEWNLNIGEGGRMSIIGAWDFIPKEVGEWADINLEKIDFVKAVKVDAICLLNDKDDSPFNEIADFIETAL